MEMRVISSWVIFHKASLSEQSLMNEDGSEFIVGFVTVADVDMKSAIAQFEQYLANDQMELLELYKVEQVTESNYKGTDKYDQKIREMASETLHDQSIRYYVTTTSETLAYEEELAREQG